MTHVVVWMVAWSGPIGLVNEDKPAVTPAEIFTRSADAMKKARHLRYQAHYEATAWISEFVPNIEGTVVMGKQSPYKIDTYTAKVSVKPKDAESPTPIDAGCDGDNYFLIDAKSKTVHRDMDPGVLGELGSETRRVILADFGKPQPYDDKNEGKTIELVGEQTIMDEPCYEIHIKGGDPPDVLWFISTRDYFPRRIVRLRKNQHDEPGSTQLTLHHVEIDPDVSPSAFAPSVPEGYKQTDEFAQ
ncbi:MAG: DUF2092 domain-containing protein [Phycisphaerales bacterium]|nr:DUF2092 domain-containing protein [Phycisphaerales bacterium]